MASLMRVVQDWLCPTYNTVLGGQVGGEVDVCVVCMRLTCRCTVAQVLWADYTAGCAAKH